MFQFNKAQYDKGTKAYISGYQGLYLRHKTKKGKALFIFDNGDILELSGEEEVELDS